MCKLSDQDLTMMKGIQALRRYKLIAVSFLILFTSSLFFDRPVLAQDVTTAATRVAVSHAPIASITVCSPNGAGGQGSCPNGSFDTHQAVLGPDNGPVNKSSLGVGAAP